MSQVSYRQRFRKCGKANCLTCTQGSGHGPYWFASWREGGKVRTKYVGRELPSDVPNQQVRVRTLGQLEVAVAGGQVVQLRRRVRELLTILLSAPNDSVGRDEVTDWLWSDSDPVAAHHNLRVTMSGLRSAMKLPGMVRFAGPMLHLRLPPGVRDDRTFEEAAGSALRNPTRQNIAIAIGLYTGDYLPEDRYNDWTTYRRQVLGQLRRKLVFRALEDMDDEGDPTVLQWLQGLLATDRCDEEVARHLMEMLFHVDRRSEAIRVFQALEASLRRELDISPDLTTRTLFNRIR